MRIGEKELHKSGENTVVVKRINNDINGNRRYKLSYFVGKEHVRDTISQAYNVEDTIDWQYGTADMPMYGFIVHECFRSKEEI